jgi:hypothetical protein
MDDLYPTPMTAQILVGLALATACAVATNVGSVLKHRGANAVPPSRRRAPTQAGALA